MVKKAATKENVGPCEVKNQLRKKFGPNVIESIEGGNTDEANDNKILDWHQNFGISPQESVGDCAFLKIVEICKFTERLSSCKGTVLFCKIGEGEHIYVRGKRPRLVNGNSGKSLSFLRA